MAYQSLSIGENMEVTHSFHQIQDIKKLDHLPFACVHRNSVKSLSFAHVLNPKVITLLLLLSLLGVKAFKGNEGVVFNCWKAIFTSISSLNMLKGEPKSIEGERQYEYTYKI